jgi:predicted RecA/RadA family phage recombinase
MKTKTNVQTVEDILITNGAMTNNGVAALTSLNTQQVATCLNQLKHTGRVHKQLTEGGPAIWSLTAPPTTVKVKTVTEGNLVMVGDLFEVAGRTKDGRIVVRTLEAPNTMYTIEGV